VTTDPRVVKGLVSVVKEGRGHALVGDSPGNAYPGRAREVFEATGMLKAIEEAGAEFVQFEGLQPRLVDIEGGKVMKNIALAEPLFNSELINVPKLKTHMQSVMTGALKNVAFGCIPGTGKGRMHVLGNSSEKLASAIADVYSAIRPHITLNVMDAITCMDGNGPSAGRVRRVGKLLASTDALALDMVSFKMAGLEVEQVPYVKEAISRSLGPANIDEIEIRGELPNLSFRLPSTFFSMMASSLGGTFVRYMNSSVSVERSKCTRCGSCCGACPVSAITLGPYAEIDQSKCIRCFVCHEVCEANAIKVRHPLLRR
jgi:uncharacterized protein (DUF362 family)/NAD-dependent dihydropyrimidine dehydrogenase PreA subunit